MLRDARHIDAAAMRGQDSSCNCQTHARPLARALPASIELLEDQRQVNRIDARTVIFNAELDSICGMVAPQDDTTARRAIPCRILKQVAQHAAQQMRVKPNGLVWLIHLNEHIVPIQDRVRFLHRMLKQGARTIRFGMNLDRVGIQFRHLDRFADQRIQLRALFVDNRNQLEPRLIIQALGLAQGRYRRPYRRERCTKLVCHRVDQRRSQPFRFPQGIEPRRSLDCNRPRESDGHLGGESGGHFPRKIAPPPPQ